MTLQRSTLFYSQAAAALFYCVCTAASIMLLPGIATAMAVDHIASIFCPGLGCTAGFLQTLMVLTTQWDEYCPAAASVQLTCIAVASACTAHAVPVVVAQVLSVHAAAIAAADHQPADALSVLILQEEQEREH